jgi:hypothetical protein
MHGLYLAHMLNFRYLDPFWALAGRPGFLIDTRARQRAEKDITTFDNTILLKRFSDHFWHLELTQRPNPTQPRQKSVPSTKICPVHGRVGMGIRHTG